MRNKTKNYLENKDSIFSVIYWRKKYNTKCAELEVMKEVMASDVYEQVIKSLSEPLELVRYKRENERLRNLIKVIREERNELLSEVKELKNAKKSKK